ncbi:MAG TPA: hypothetical protein VFB43_12025 [Terracidiphilus sp.]|nr:hypothetical protein [Terracidiphilus sp.]
MKLTVIALSFFLTAAGLSAQAVIQPGASSGSMQKLDSSASAVTPWSNMSGCPVALRATQISSADMMQVRKGQQTKGQRLHLAFTNHGAKQIVAATVNVQGYASTPGVIMTVAKPSTGSPALVTRTIQIAFGPQTGENLATNILVPDVPATQTIDLVSLAYADGTGWKLAAGQACRITPDPLMLISASSR